MVRYKDWAEHKCFPKKNIKKTNFKNEKSASMKAKNEEIKGGSRLLRCTVSLSEQTYNMQILSANAVTLSHLKWFIND